MSKKCSVKVGGKPCGVKVALKDYATHLKQKHNIELLVNPIQQYIHVHEQVEYIYDQSNAALNKDGVLVDCVLRWFWHMVIYDQKTKRVQIDMEYEDFIDYLVPLVETITRSGRDLRAECLKSRKKREESLKIGKDIPELHPDWKLSEHVKVFRGSKFISYRDFFKARKKIEMI